MILVVMMTVNQMMMTPMKEATKRKEAKAATKMMKIKEEKVKKVERKVVIKELKEETNKNASNNDHTIK